MIETELVIAGLLLWILGIVVVVVRRSPSGALQRARARRLVDTPRWLGVIALLLGVFGLYAVHDPLLARMVVDYHMDGRIAWERSLGPLSRLMAVSAGVCAVGFLATWGLSEWIERRWSR